MQKDRRYLSRRCNASPYSSYDKSNNRTPELPSIPIGNEKEYEEARCPICMEHPHNAVLLLCSSGEKGCRPYMCDTSSRHSNCLDQFRKSAMKYAGNSNKLVCPLCRGEVKGWTVVNAAARELMNSKTRTCSLGTCGFVGSYSQLREHARCVHPCVRPTDVDPERELEWRCLEEVTEHQDMVNVQFDDNDADGFMDGESYYDNPVWDDYFTPQFDSDSDDIVFDDFDSMYDYYSGI